MFLKVLKSVERVIVGSLVVMMTLVLIFAAVDLGWLLFNDLFISEPLFILSVNDLLELFGLFMLVLIGIELLETIIRTYVQRESFHVEVVLSVAIIAVARKIIIMDLKDMQPHSLLGIAAMTICLCAGYYLLRKSRLEAKDAGALLSSSPRDKTDAS